MKLLFLTILVLLFVFPINSSFSQSTDVPQTLAVVLTSDVPFVYYDNGSIVVVGEVENRSNSFVTDVKIQATFYDQLGTRTTEIITGSPILNFIPPNEKSPYSISLTSENPNLSVSVKVIDFDSAAKKQEMLTIEPGASAKDDKFHFQGTLKNIGGADSSETTVYVAFYDAFIPPRILGVSSINLGMLEIGNSKDFQFVESIDSRAVNFSVFAESDIFSSEKTDIPIIRYELANSLVTISDVYITDSKGEKITDVKAGTPTFIQSKTWIQFQQDNASNIQPYVLYTQIKQSGEKPFVEFLGISEGNFVYSGNEYPNVQWIPENPGLYFIETYVWDSNDVPIASPGPIILVVVN